MALPKRRHSNARTGTRRAHDHKTAPGLTFCEKCSKAVPPHTICPNCGTYMGRKITDVETKKKK
jgi:large subunit ribosomal protein L32